MSVRPLNPSVPRYRRKYRGLPSRELLVPGTSHLAPSQQYSPIGVGGPQKGRDNAKLNLCTCLVTLFRIQVPVGCNRVPSQFFHSHFHKGRPSSSIHRLSGAMEQAEGPDTEVVNHWSTNGAAAAPLLSSKYLSLGSDTIPRCFTISSAGMSAESQRPATAKGLSWRPLPLPMTQRLTAIR